MHADPKKLEELTPKLWHRVSELFDEVIDLDDSKRIQFVRTLWSSEPDAAQELLALLVAAADVSKSTSLESAPFDSALRAALSEPAMGYRSGQKFGAWTLENRLGKGGMGEVWRALRSDGLYNAAVAIKLLRTDLSHDTLSRRFARERALLARLNHPNIVRLLDAGIENEQAFIVLELVDGVPLLEYVAAHAPKIEQRLQLIRDVALAVDHAHHQYVLHRDLKPSNVLVTRNGHVKLLDFGIAGVLDEDPDAPKTKLTQLTGRGLTLEYASPEQITGDRTMPASDVYSLGVLLYHLCTGNRPFAHSSTRAALEYAVVHSDPPLASAALSMSATTRPVPDSIDPPSDSHKLTGDLDEIIRRAMRLAPEDRYPTAAALATDLEAWISSRPTSRHAQDRVYALRLWLRRHWQIAAIALTVVVGVVGAGLWRHYSVQTSAREAAARQLLLNEALGDAVKRLREEVSMPTSGAAEKAAKSERVEQLLQQVESRFGNDAAMREEFRKHIALSQPSVTPNR